ncbi:VC2046/SO_2500 family protein [Gallaecimonas kandeliae]|uniref:VC2046/SO_2500 family protein n=1 Tax=Gallaecimonas kandeliae TaxID=3029055 RepID=UPI0026490AF7|nr:VC2046/SO_2500 family protein [Gallaecimonas kandeliae]WKE66864.1 VC2046/SO_2500 family protein [Gallaecimonas kandeliae]
MQINGLAFQDELQLAPKLASAVASGQRSDFALLLAMLGNDLLEKPGLASPELGEGLAAQPFELPPKRPLGADERTPARSQALSDLFHKEGMVAARLFDCLDPEPQLDRRDDKAYLPEALLDDLDPKAAWQAKGQALPSRPGLTANADLGEVLSRLRQAVA